MAKETQPDQIVNYVRQGIAVNTVLMRQFLVSQMVSHTKAGTPGLYGSYDRIARLITYGLRQAAIQIEYVV
jgi:hypothetical protein